MNWIPEYWIGETYYPPRQIMTDSFTREELLQMVANQAHTIHQLRTIIEESLTAIDNEAPDLAWRKLLQARERFEVND